MRQAIRRDAPAALHGGRLRLKHLMQASVSACQAGCDKASRRVLRTIPRTSRRLTPALVNAELAGRAATVAELFENPGDEFGRKRAVEHHRHPPSPLSRRRHRAFLENHQRAGLRAIVAGGGANLLVTSNLSLRKIEQLTNLSAAHLRSNQS